MLYIAIAIIYYTVIRVLCQYSQHAGERLVSFSAGLPKLLDNAAELGARKVVRKRDISLHTWTDWGTELRDALLSIVETARKLKVPVYNYINDRITRQYMLPSLAELVMVNSAYRLYSLLIRWNRSKCVAKLPLWSSYARISSGGSHGFSRTF